MKHTFDDIMFKTTVDYLDGLKAANPNTWPPPDTIQEELLNLCANAILAENVLRVKNERLTIPKRLLPMQVGLILLYTQDIRNITFLDSDSHFEDDDAGLLAIYQDDGPDEGIYVPSEKLIRNETRKFGFTMTPSEIDATIKYLKDEAPSACRCMNRDLIAVNNGIFNYATKELLPFSPDLVFVAKSRVDYHPLAPNPIIINPDGTSWDVESWLSELTGDPEVTQLLWEILGAIIRPFVRWNKSAWLYSETGNNGKGTLCELMRQLCGSGSYTSLPLSDTAKDFALQSLVTANAIITDENDVGTYIDKAANLKALITNDPLRVDRKFKSPITFQFFGFMVQCVNEIPRIKDRSESLYRRQLFIPFNKCFTGAERKYIKTDYLHRKEVLEYVLCKTLNSNYYELSEPQVCKDALEMYKEYNDPVRQFVNEMLPRVVWDLLPFGFLYELYKAWLKETHPSSSALGRNTFIDNLITVIQDNDQWYTLGKGKQVRPGAMMNAAEPLLAEYNLTSWIDTRNAHAISLEVRCHPVLQTHYTGLLRRK